LTTVDPTAQQQEQQVQQQQQQIEALQRAQQNQALAQLCVAAGGQWDPQMTDGGGCIPAWENAGYGG